MPSALQRLVCLLFVLGGCLCANAQGAASASAQKAQGAATSQMPTEAAPVEPVPRVPGLSTLLRGFDAGVTLSAVHDSSVGWFSVAIPAVSYSFSPHFAVDASLPVYPYRLVWNEVSTTPITERLVERQGDLGDTLVGLHASFNPSALQNTATASLNLPSGSHTDGLGAGKVTFDFSEHMVRYLRQTGILVDLGVGDSSSLVNSLVAKDYSAVGPLAHFQAGAIVWIFGRDYLQSVAYEQLPLGAQTVVTTANPRGLPNPTVVSVNTVSEDNGFTTLLGIPLTDHLTLSSYYNRSLRQHVDTVSMGVTFVLRGNRRNRELALIDKALREAAREVR